MSLYFKDKQENMHEIELQVIKSKSLKKGDVLVVNYEVGDATVKDANQALSQLREIFKRILPEGVEIAVIATRNGKEDVSIKIVKDKTKE